MVSLRGLLASPGLDQAPVKAVYFFPGEGSDDGSWTTHPLDIRDRHWNSDDSARGWVLDRMAAAHVNTIVASWWNTLPESSPMALADPQSPISPSWRWLVDAAGTRPLVILPAIEGGDGPQWQFANEFPSSEPAGLVDRIGWLREVFAGRMDLWARMYDEAGNPRYAVSILHAWSNLIDPGSDEAFASGFDTVAQHVRDRYQIEVGFTLDTSRGPRYSAGPAAAGPFLARTAPVLAIHGFEAEIFSGKVLIGVDNNANGNISLMADWKRAAMNDWIATGVPIILDVSNGYDARKVFPENPWHWGDNLDYTDDRWRNWVSQLKNPGIAGICVDCWNGYTEGYAMVPSQEHQNTVYNWLTDLLEPDPRDYSHMHYENGAATHRVYGAICEKWIKTGADRSFGAPITDEGPSGPGREQGFTDGKSIYWGKDTGAFEVHGLIGKAYRDVGGGASRLGLPVSDEEPHATGRINRFQHGEITWTPGAAAAQIHYS